MNKIQNAHEFRQYVLQLIKHNEDSSRTLEEYLLALLQRIQIAKNAQPSYQDIASFLRDSYAGEVVQFSEDWNDLPSLTTELNSEAYYVEIRTYGYLERMLKIRISGLRQLRKDGTLNKDSKNLWLNGADDYRGFRWYNFAVSNFLERGSELFENIEPWEENFDAPEGWIELGFIITDGASYE